MPRSWPALEINFEHPVNPTASPWELLWAALTDFDVAAVDEDSSRVFFHSADERDRARSALQQHFPTLAIAPVEIPDEDWAARSQANITAVHIGRITVAPPWDVGAVAESRNPGITIIIQPSMGFGTGHHATTRLCLAHLQDLSLERCSVLDVGTGSGVLAIAASRLGATQVLAIDDDPDAIESARDNISLNDGVEVTLGTIDLRRAPLRAFNVVLANLTGGLLISAGATLQQLTLSGGRLVLSGFMAAEEREVMTQFASCTIEQRSQEDEWVCVTLLRSR